MIAFVHWIEKFLEEKGIDLKLSTILANLADDLQFTDDEFDSVIWRGYISIAYGVIIGAIIVFWMRPLLK